MRTTIDAAGRVVIPKSFRDQLGLTGGHQIDVAMHDGRIEISVPGSPMRLEGAGRDVYAVPDPPDREMPALTPEIVRETLERVRR